MLELQKALKQNPIVYVTRDLERAIGLSPKYQGYYIITNSTPFAKEYTKGKKNILLIKNSHLLDTRDLLTHPTTQRFFKKLKNPRIVVFKNTSQIEKICAELGVELLNPSAELANTVEEKISQIYWLGELTKYLPPFKIMQCNDLTWPLVIPSETVKRRTTSPKGALSGESRSRKTKLDFSPRLNVGVRNDNLDNERKYIIQFNRAHTGSGTLLIESEKQVNELKQKFPNREVRVTQFISGPAFTNNNVVNGKKVLIGNINYQITGLSPFTTRPFATIGNDWALPSKLLSSKQIKQYKQIATDVGKKLAHDGWKGLFGIDVIMDEKTGKVYLIEINARQPASTTFESQLQQSVISIPTESGEKSNLHRSNTRSLANARDNNYVTTFQTHLASLINLPTTSYKLQAITDGAQVVLKAKGIRSKDQAVMKKIKKLKDLKLNVIPYTNSEVESDLLRIQSKKEVMQKHNEFNKLGNKIADIMSFRA